jgi:hypothetical protein
LITLHHLTPKQKGGKAEHRTPLCRPCHKQIHATFTNTELFQQFDSLELLRQAPQLQSFLRWIRKQRLDRNCRTRESTVRGGGMRIRRRRVRGSPGELSITASADVAGLRRGGLA